MATTSALAKLPGAICTPKNHHARLCDVCYNGEIVVTTVRNHWDAVASWWLLDSRRLSLWNFIDGYNHSFYARGNKLWWLHPEATVILKYETLQADLDNLLISLGLEPIQILKENVTQDKTHYLDYYSKTTYQKVLEHFYDEIIFYGYANATEKDTIEAGTRSQDPGGAN